MSKPDTSRENVLEHANYLEGTSHPNVWSTGPLLRALLDERDELKRRLRMAEEGVTDEEVAETMLPPWPHHDD